MRAAAIVLTCLALSYPDAPAAQAGAPAAPVSGGTTAVSAQGSSGPVPRVFNGRLAPQASAGNVDATFRRLMAAQVEAVWIGYSVPLVSRSEGRLCCSGDTWISDGIVFTNGRIATCGLEPSTSSTRRTSDQPAQMQNPVRLEGPDSVVVLYRVEERAVQRIRIFSPDCELDAGGRTIHWLEGVDSTRLGAAAGDIRVEGGREVRSPDRRGHQRDRDASRRRR